jgi:hypothetical protein
VARECAATRHTAAAGIGLVAGRHAIDIHCRDGVVAAIPFPMELVSALSPDRTAEEKAAIEAKIEIGQRSLLTS